MSTATCSDSTASDQLLESVGKASLAGGTAVVLLLAIASWYTGELALWQSDISELGLGDPAFWFVVGPILGAAAGSTVLLRNVIVSRTRWLPTSPIDVAHLFAGAGIVAVYLLTSLASSSMDVASPDGLIVAVILLAVTSAVSESVVNRWLRLAGRQQVLAVVLVLLLGIAIPTGIGAAINDPSSDHTIDIGPNDSAEPPDWDPTNESKDEPLAPADWMSLASIETESDVPENLTDYEPARVEPLEGEIASPATSSPVYPLSIPLVETNGTDILRKHAEPIDDADEYLYLGTEIDGDGLVLDTFGHTGEIVLFVDVVEDGRIIRYQRTVDLSELE